MYKTAIITGASSGFGLLTTVELARRGFHVLATMRNMQKSQTFQTMTEDSKILNRIHAFPLDVTNQDSIQTFQHKVEQLEQVDVLVNNAGFAVGGFAEDVSLDAYRRQFEANVFGVMAVTQVVLPKMRQQGFGKVINVSSISGKIAFPGLSPYVASKHALEGYTESLRLEVKPFGVQVALVEPGSYKTNIWSTGMEVAEDSMKDDSAYQGYMEAIYSQLETGKQKHGDAKEVAYLIADLSDRKHFRKLHYPIGKGVKVLLWIKQTLPWNRWEQLVLSKLGMKK